MTDTTNPNREQAREVLARYPRSRAAGIRSEESIIAAMLEFAALPTPEAERVWPDIGTDPLKGDRRSEEDGRKLLREAYIRQQPHVPDQTALVWRGDLGRTLNLVTRLVALTERRGATNDPAGNAGEVERVREPLALMMQLRGWQGSARDVRQGRWDGDIARFLAALHRTQDSRDVAGAAPGEASDPDHWMYAQDGSPTDA